MKFARLLTVALVAVASAVAADVSKVFQIKYADVNQLAQILRVVAGNSILQPNDSLKVLSVRGPEESVNAVADAIQRFDTPDAAPKNVQLTAWFLLGMQKAPVALVSLPPELADVVTQLKKVFSNYREFSMLDVLSVRSRGGTGSDTSGVLPRMPSDGLPMGTHVRSSFQVRTVSVGAGEKGKTVHLDRLQVNLLFPEIHDGKLAYAGAGINTDIDVPEGQKVIVGQSNTTVPDQALFIVLTAKVVE